MLYNSYVYAIKSANTGLQIHSKPMGVFAANEYEAIGKLRKYCLSIFPPTEGYSNHDIGCFELSEEELKRGLREIVERNENL